MFGPYFSLLCWTAASQRPAFDFLLHLKIVKTTGELITQDEYKIGIPWKTPINKLILTICACRHICVLTCMETRTDVTSDANTTERAK